MGDRNVCPSCGGDSLDPPLAGCKTPGFSHVHESYMERRARQYAEQEKRAKAPETEAELTEVLNRDDEVLDENESWNETFHEVTVTFKWSDISRYTEGAMESIETVDEDPIGTAVDAWLNPTYETDTFEVVSKTHRTEYEDDDH